MRAIQLPSNPLALAETIQSVVQDHAPVILTSRPDGEPVVLMSLADYESFAETNYLFATPANAKSLMASIEQIDLGHVRRLELPE